MLDTYRVRALIEEINNRVRVLNKDFKPLSEEELTGDYSLNAAAEHHLQIAIQACIDIANHIISKLTLRRPEKLSEVFQTLAKENILPKSLADDLSEAVKYRNVIVHFYKEVDTHFTYDNIQNHLPDLSQFAKYIEEFLEKQESKAKPDTNG